MTHFDRCVAIVIDEHEKGFVNDPNDPGGPTKWGISLRFAAGVGDMDHDGRPDLDTDGDGDVDIDDIRALPRSDAESMYRLIFWLPLHCDTLPPALAYALFDTAINMGRGTAIMLLQRALKIKDDGKLGPVTMSAAAKATPRTLRLFLAHRAWHYSKLDGFQHYALGWLARCFDVQHTAESMT